MRILSADGAPVKNSNQSLYTAPTEKYFPRDNDFTDHVAPTLTGAEAKLYDEIVRLCDRTTGYCPYNELSLACKAKLGYSTVRAAVPVLEACGLVAKRPQRKYFGVDTMGREQWHDEGNHFQVLAKECWIIFPKAPRKPRNGPRPEVSPEDLAPRTLAEIKQEAAKIKLETANFQQMRAKNKRSKQDLSFKTSSQDKQQPRAKKSRAAATPDVAVVDEQSSQSTQSEVVCVQLDARVLVEPNFPEFPDSSIGEKTPTEVFRNSPENTLLAELIAAKVSPSVAADLVRECKPAIIRQQLDCLPYRDAKNPGAMLAKSIREGWGAPPKYLQAQQAQERAVVAAQRDKAQVLEIDEAKRSEAQKREKLAQGEDEAARLDADFEALPQMKREAIEREVDKQLSFLMPELRKRPIARIPVRRNVQKVWAAEAQK